MLFCHHTYTWIMSFEVKVMAVKNIFQHSSSGFDSPANILDVFPSECLSSSNSPVMQMEKSTSDRHGVKCAGGFNSVHFKT